VKANRFHAYLPVVAGALLCLAFTSALAQYTSSKVVLKAQINLATFGASNGNSCWGYVSRSGKEYALMGLSNKLAIVDITDPANPDWFASVPHLDGLWMDVKVYKNYAYVVTEESGSGIQVIDLSDVDNHNVTLVRTISTIGRSHTCHIDTVNGFLYTCGSHESGGTTTCWNLADPANPVRVGPASLTGNYIHESYVHAYTSGPYAGKQIFFGCSTDQGLEIWDFTDKAHPVKIKTMTYPNIGYCHQCWMSEDEKYLYMDDEFDESMFGFDTRTVVFDVSSLENGHYVTTFTTGIGTIDHNQYLIDGFIYQSNYKSGLHIFDTNDNQTAPTQVGWFDTYPEDDTQGYEGLWSNYPFFPSGTVIGSDINRGLFIWDVTEAVTRVISPSAYHMDRGSVLAGNLDSIKTSDDSYMTLRPGATFSTSEAAIQLVVEQKAPSKTPRLLKFKLESHASVSSLDQKIALYNFRTNSYENVDTRRATTTDSTVEVAATGDLSRFVNQTDKGIRAKVSYKSTSAVFAWPYTASIDQIVWSVAP
jgi:choice-of-anchor B domain-containing protein